MSNPTEFNLTRLRQLVNDDRLHVVYSNTDDGEITSLLPLVDKERLVRVSDLSALLTDVDAQQDTAMTVQSAVSGAGTMFNRGFDEPADAHRPAAQPTPFRYPRDSDGFALCHHGRRVTCEECIAEEEG